jgi:D-beta-D-heptose 7-phosphate kinase/D-beta-D-heptose 1-phosphate adenosyltransferase
MATFERAQGESISPANLLSRLQAAREQGKRIVTTNGCLDFLHAGHLQFLASAKSLGDVLIVGLSTDEGVTRLKGPGRPIIPLEERATMLVALGSVDHVIDYDDLLPNEFL